MHTSYTQLTEWASRDAARLLHMHVTVSVLRVLFHTQVHNAMGAIQRLSGHDGHGCFLVSPALANVPELTPMSLCCILSNMAYLHCAGCTSAPQLLCPVAACIPCT